MYTQAQIEEFHLLSQRNAHEIARRLEKEQRTYRRQFLADPEPITGFGLPLDFATQHGREVLVQTHDFEETNHG